MRQRITPLLLALCLGAVSAVHAQPRTEITFARFFGLCDADYGRQTDPAQASGECGLITTLVNRFNASNGQGYVVRAQPIEHGAYYQQLGARIVGRDVPTVAIMHSSVLNDFAKRRLLTPLDAPFAAAGIDVADFTEHARRAVTLADGRIAALPLDTHAWLWHFNGNLLRQAGLANADGTPRMPRSPEELLEHARRFKATTGKPYFVWLTANDTAFMSRTLITLVEQQRGHLFPPGDTVALNLRSAEAQRVMALMKQLYDERLTTRDLDYSAAVQSFVNGGGGVMINGTWLIDALVQQAKRPGSALHGGYSAAPFATLFQQPAAWADSHLLVMLEGGAKTEPERRAALAFLKFMNDQGGHWARTGQLPTRRSVLDSAAFRALPMRPQIQALATSGAAMPIGVARQFRVQGVIGEAMGAIVVNGADADTVLPKVESSMRRMLTREQQFLQGL
jgi:multiple sugar transport system substrate-binding protein